MMTTRRAYSITMLSCVEKTKVTTLGILGAGVMGAGIAFAAAKVGIEVVLKDLNIENAEKGKAFGHTKRGYKPIYYYCL